MCSFDLLQMLVQSLLSIKKGGMKTEWVLKWLNQQQHLHRKSHEHRVVINKKYVLHWSMETGNIWISPSDTTSNRKSNHKPLSDWTFSGRTAMVIVQGISTKLVVDFMLMPFCFDDLFVTFWSFESSENCRKINQWFGYGSKLGTPIIGWLILN